MRIEVMYTALRAKFTSYPSLKSLLLSTTGSILSEGSPHDLYWGSGRDGEGLNHLGRLLMRLRAEFLREEHSSIPNYVGMESIEHASS